MKCVKMLFGFKIIFGGVDRKKFVEEMLRLEKKNIWIQYIPCAYVICRRALEIATTYAIKDYFHKKMIARKLNLQVALRYFGMTQVRDVISILEGTEDDKVAIIIISEDADKVVAELCKRGIIRSLVDENECRADIARIIRIFGLSEDIIRSQSEARQLNLVDILERFIIENIATKFLMK